MGMEIISVHRRLIMRLSERVPVVMTDEYKTAKACPLCKNYDFNMKCPQGNVSYFHLEKEYRKEYTDCLIADATKKFHVIISHL